MTILGNEANIRHFTMGFRLGKLSHAYLVCGAEGSGKKTFTEYIAAALLCEKTAQETGAEYLAPCGTCPACMKTATGNHPDLIHVTHKKETVITVGEIRQQVVEDIAVKPFYGAFKVYVIEDADLMNVNAQNALLKTIEEPPSYGILFLLTSNPDGLLETVHSRCLRLDMDLLSDDAVVHFLCSVHGIDPEKAQEAAAFARGNAGRALALAKETGIWEIREAVSSWMRQLGSADAIEISTQAKEMESMDVRKTLDVFRMWFRDVLLVKTSREVKTLYFPESYPDIKAQAQLFSYEDINCIFACVDETLLQIDANVKTEAAAEVMLLKIRQKFFK